MISFHDNIAVETNMNTRVARTKMIWSIQLPLQKLLVIVGMVTVNIAWTLW